MKFYINLNLTLGSIDQTLLICLMVINNKFVSPYLIVMNFITLYFSCKKKKKKKKNTQYIPDSPLLRRKCQPLNTLTKIEHPYRSYL